MVVVSLAESFPVLVSPPPETETELVTLAAALLATFRSEERRVGKEWEARGSLRVQVKVTTTQVQPVPLIAVGVRPAGKVSVTETAALVGAKPELVAVIV